MITQFIPHGDEPKAAPEQIGDEVMRLRSENNALKALLREALPTINVDMADAWRTGLKQRIEFALSVKANTP